MLNHAMYCIKNPKTVTSAGQNTIMMLTLLLLLAAALNVFLGSSKTIVISHNGNDDTTCLENFSHPCRSLDYVATHYSENVVYQVDGVSALKSAAVFNASNITIVGSSSSSSELVCPQNCSSCGLAFLHCRLVTLQNVAITGCGTEQNFSSHGRGLPYKSAVILHTCSDVSLVDITVRDSRGYGVVLFNSAGEVIVSHSHFLNSTMPSGASNHEVLGGAGMRIVVSFCDIHASSCNKTQRQAANYSITHSVFKDSNVTGILEKPPSLTYGGGLGVLLWWGAHNNSVTITNSTFADNKCPCGAGASLLCNMDSTDNQIHVHHSTFCNNSLTESLTDKLGGAGASVGIASDNYKSFPNGNNITFENCYFSHNTGYYGAGTLVYGAAAVNSNTSGSNRLNFTECGWEQNTGVVSPALDIGPDFFGTYENSFIVNISFRNCYFSNNYVSNLHKNNSHYHSALGVVLIAQFHVYFSDNTCFENNQGSALAAFSAHIVFGDGSVTTFINNTGRARGGALVLYEYSTLRYWNNTRFNFTNNKSLFMGGAIYVTKYSEHNQFSSRSCFMHYSNEYVYNNVDFKLNVSFFFENNTAEYGFAHSIFANSVRPCQHFCLVSDIHEVFSNQSCLGHFQFDNRSHQIGTEGTNFTFYYSPPYKMIPGHKYILPITITDEFENNALNITEFQSHVNSPNISVDPAHLFVTNNTVAIDGEPGSKGNLFLIGTRSNEEIRVEIQLAPCAPGYVAKRGSKGFVKCVCSAIYRDTHYHGIVGCNYSAGTGKALIVPGMWAGYVGKNINEHTLYTGFCVHGYCKDFFTHTKSMTPVELCSNASQDELNKIMCAQNRHGILCGDCTTNNSVHYHSRTFACRSNRLCAVGFLFYILSELLPAAILLILILFLNINLTSGSAYSLIFMVNTLQAMRFSFVSEHRFQSTLIDIAMMIYNTLNLEFFSLERLSFCLWAGASALDILIMKYATVLFAFGLVAFTVLMVRYCNIKLCRHPVCRRSHISFVQGLSALLVISYSQCVLVTFYTLDLTMITGMGANPHTMTVVYVDGAVPYFSRGHLKYAIPAVLVLTIIVIPISVILVGDQFFLKLEYIINQHCCPRRYRYPYTLFREQFKPLFDSFQGCFKDEYRFMSGLFFIYRIVILLVLVITPRPDWFYGFVQLVLVIMLTIQALLQPFQETKHNMLAVLVFFMLSLINCFSIIKYQFMYSDAVYVFQWFWLVLVYLPIIIGAGWCMWRALKWAYNKLRHDYFEISDEQASSNEISGISLNRL